MKLKLLGAVATAAIIATPSIAAADDAGWYLRGNVGYGTHTDMDFTGDLVGDVESEGNGAFSVGLGYDFGDNWRLELDGASLWTDLGKIGNENSSFAKLRTNNLMLNAIYDLDDFGSWSPYIGAGAGIVRGEVTGVAHNFFNADNTEVVQSRACTGNACSFKDTLDGIAWQLIAGLGYDISDKLTWDTQYRYFNSSDLKSLEGLVQNGYSTVGNGYTNLEDVGGHMLMTGLRYKFGSPTPMVTCWDGSEVKMIGNCPARPVMVTCWDGSSFEEGSGGTCPAQPEPVRYVTCWDGSSVEEGTACPAQPQVTCWDGSIVSDSAFCPVETRSGQTVASLCGNQYRQEIIYYEFDRGQSAETRNTINRILDIGEFCRVDNIRVVGHTDTSGSAAYNLQLSKRRAKDARDELVRQGINSSVITSEGKGETEPFVPTGDGVKEQLNRRTEVLITLSEVGGIN